jgi:hypothetical protein
MSRMVCGPSRITVAITPTWPWDPQAEAAMIKAALLYADRISVISPTTVLLREAQRLRLRTVSQQIETLRQVIPRMTDEPLETARRLRGLALAETALRRMPSEPSVRGTVLSQVESTARTIVSIAEGFLAEAELTGLTALEAEGIVAYERLPGQDETRLLAAGLCAAALAHEGETPRECDRQLLAGVYLRKLARHQSRADGLLMLDMPGRRLVEDGRVDSELLGSLPAWPIARLPIFPEASAEELLDIRRTAPVSLSDICRTASSSEASSDKKAAGMSSHPSLSRLQLALGELAHTTMEARERQAGSVGGLVGSASASRSSVSVMALPARDKDAERSWPLCLVVEPDDCRADLDRAADTRLVGVPIWGQRH